MKLPDYKIGERFYFYNRFKKIIEFGEIVESGTTRGWCLKESRVPQIRYKMKVSEKELVWIEERYLDKEKDILEKYINQKHLPTPQWVVNTRGKFLREY